MLKKIIVLLLCCAWCDASLYAQQKVDVNKYLGKPAPKKGSELKTQGTLLGFSYTPSLPGAAMAQRYGFTNVTTGQYWYKNTNNFMFGVSGSFLFGNTVNESHLFDSISTPSGFVIDRNGTLTDLRLYERGFMISAGVGKIYYLGGRTKNSGLWVQFDMGFMQHNIRIETIGNNTPQLSDDYKAGYDRLTNGTMLHQNIGYMYLDNKRYINYFIGADFTEGFTQGRRSFQFDTRMPYNQKRFDFLYGIRFGFILPIYKHPKNEEFYY